MGRIRGNSMGRQGGETGALGRRIHYDDPHFMEINEGRFCPGKANVVRIKRPSLSSQWPRGIKSRPTFCRSSP